MKEYIPAAHLQKYIHRFRIVSSAEPMAAEKCVMDGFVKLLIYLHDNPAPDWFDIIYLDWFDIIYDCGYFDQTHFIKDFKHFTGEPPVAFYSKPHPIEAVVCRTGLEKSQMNL
jgi:AraC-like DNA-binding protein